MKKIYSILVLVVFAIVVSCTDDNLDPLQFKKVSKGTLLALRGAYLDAIYFDETSGASFVPLITDGSDKFTYDAEFLSEDPSLLESIDVYAEDSTGARQLLKNYPKSAFTTSSETGRPIITVSFTLAEIFPKIGVKAKFPTKLRQAQVDSLLHGYKAGINIVTDINLTDGTKVLADDMVAAGLYQSDQFFPAMRLPFDLVEYCPYVEGDWSGEYKALEILSDDTNGPYDFEFTQTDVDKYHAVGIFGKDGSTAAIEFDIVFKPSTDPYDQKIADITTTVGGKDFKATKGTYEQCTGIITMAVAYGPAGKETKWTYQFSKK